MTTRYVDNTLSGTTATYNPTTRLPTGGSDAAYVDLVTAYAAASHDDIIECRSGSAGTLASQMSIAKRLTIRPYNGETAWLNAGNFDNDHISITVTGPGTWGLDIDGGGEGNQIARRIIIAQGANWTFDVEFRNLGSCVAFRSTGAINGLSSTKLRVIDCDAALQFNNTGTGATWSGIVSRRTKSASITNDESIVVSNGTHTFESPVIIGGACYSSANAAFKVSGATTVTVNTPKFIGWGIDHALNVVKTLSYTVRTISAASTLTINGGIINGHWLAPELRTYYQEAGTINLVGVLLNGFVDDYTFVDDDERAMVFSFISSDSNHTKIDASPPWNVSRSLDHWNTCMKAAKCGMSYYPDDMYTDGFREGSGIFGVTSQENSIKDFVAHPLNELGMQNISSTALTHTWAFGIKLPAGSTVAEVDVVIPVGSGSFSVYNVATGALIGTITNTGWIGNSLTTKDGDTAQKFNTFAVGGTTFDVEYNNLDSDPPIHINSFDDGDPNIFTPGTYRVNKAAYTRFTIDLDRWLQVEVTDVKPTIEAFFETTVVGFDHFRESLLSGDAKTKIQALGFEYAVGGNNDTTGSGPGDFINTVRSIDYYAMGCLTTVVSYLQGTTANYNANPEWTIRQYARNMATNMHLFGLYPIWVLPRVKDPDGAYDSKFLSANDVKNIVDELESCGVNVVPVRDAVRTIKAIKAGTPRTEITRYART